MKEALIAIGDFISAFTGFISGIWEQFQHVTESLTSGWTYFQNFFLSQAPAFFVGFFYTLLGVLVFALLASLFGGKG